MPIIILTNLSDESVEKGNKEGYAKKSKIHSNSAATQRSPISYADVNQSPNSGDGLQRSCQLEDYQNQMDIKISKMKFPKYEPLAARIASFTNWPVQIKQTPQQMAEAGLFFTGSGDCVRCFVCGGKLCSWCTNDDPWIEHCRLFPLCSYARKQKGEDFIAQAYNAANKDNELLDCCQSNIVDHQKVRADIEGKRGELLKMGFEDFDIQKTVWHMQNMGYTQPTLEKLIGALVALKKTER